ncbi:MAG: AI-2E family transporter [Lachnospiraceae bacterium]|nr:AI-2E family transporter [Lachnospiraceae bacterium]
MKDRKLKSKPWYPGAVAACIAVVLYVVLTRFGSVKEHLAAFIRYFNPLLLGLAIAYLVNPLSRLYQRSICRRMKNEKKKEKTSNALAFVTVFVGLASLLFITLPQLIASITDFVGNLEGYIKTLEDVLGRWGLLKKLGIDSSQFITSTEDIMKNVGEYLTENINDVLDATVGAGKGIVTFLLGFILSVYLLAEKNTLRAGIARLSHSLMGEKRHTRWAVFITRCDEILSRYIVFNVIDCLIVGLLNAAFMLICGMPYVGLVSFTIALANLIPTFGPIIGAAIGVFLLLLVKPWFAFLFLIFTVVLQIVDAYIIKPKLFESSLGVSGLWIMIGVIIGGRIFGILGILLAVPGIAILDYVYREIFLPRLERRREAKDGTEVPDGTEEAADDIPESMEGGEEAPAEESGKDPAEESGEGPSEESGEGLPQDEDIT